MPRSDGKSEETASETAPEATTTNAEEPKKKKRKISLPVVLRESREVLWAHRRRLALGLVLLVISRLAGLVLPGSTKYIVDEVITKGRAELLPWIASAAAAATVIQAATGFALSLVLGVAAQRAISDLRLRVQQHIGLLPVRYFENHKSGVLISRIINDAEGLRNLVGTGFVQLVGGMFTATVALAVLFWIDWRLTAVTLVLLLLFSSVMGVGFSKLRPIFRERNRLMAEVTGRLTETLGGVRVVKAYTAEKREARMFAGNIHNLLRNVVRSMVGITTVSSLSGLLFGLLGLAMSVIGAREVLAGRMTLGDVFLYVIFTGMLVAPLVQISSIVTQLSEAFAGLDRIREVLAEPTERDLDEGRQPMPRIRGDIRFEDVVFEYDEDVPVLKGVSFEAPAGTTTALVGPSGSGKSTLISLVMAFNRPRTGRVLVDGEDLQEIRLKDFRSQLGIVLQDNFLFDGTVRENIAYSRPHASLEEIQAAAKIAHCDEFVERFDKAYDTVVGERGVKLSGGQRQRIAIARAILADPRILILDEATSSLDSESEERIQDGLQALLKGRTTFVIAHRLSTIRNAEQILVLADGEITEQGPHEELLLQGGLYRSLYDKQYRFEKNLFINPGEDFTPEAEAEPAVPVPEASSRL